MGGQGGCERRSEVIVKMQKSKVWSGMGGGGGGGGGGGQVGSGMGGRGVGVGQGGGGWLVAKLGVGGDVGYGGCGPRIEGIVQCT